jgi:hypothetical protein
MTHFPHDMTLCHGVGCPVRSLCACAVGPIEPNRCYSFVASAREPGEPDCRYLIPLQAPAA